MKFFISRFLAKGFTVIEMMVSMAIISIMATTLYGTYPSTNKFVSFATSVTDFASQLREIQTYGASRGGTVAKGDGIYLTTSNPYNYFLFQDKIDSSSTVSGIGISNYVWDGPTIEATTTKTFLNNVMLSDICYGYETYEEYPSTAVYDPGVEVLSFACGSAGWKDVEIVFNRPKLDARISSNNTPGSYSIMNKSTRSNVCLEFIQPGVSTSTQQRSIVIRSTGEIRVLQTRCPTTPLYDSGYFVDPGDGGDDTK
jgi:prepilin-type N-terminal cleavage/methylation domain-containing protein